MRKKKVKIGWRRCLAACFSLFIFHFSFFISGTSHAQRGVYDIQQYEQSYGVSLNVEAQNNEQFVVYVDGMPVNNHPQKNVTIGQLDRQLHEVVIVLSRPQSRAAMLLLRAANPDVNVTVAFDPRSQEMYLFTDKRNLLSYTDPTFGAMQDSVPQQPMVMRSAANNAPSAPRIRVATDAAVAQMVSQMREESYDDKKLDLARAMVSQTRLKSQQIARLAETLDFSYSQVVFLKFAYTYCVDPENYDNAIEVLSFANDRDEVHEFISAQRRQ